MKEILLMDFCIHNFGTSNLNINSGHMDVLNKFQQNLVNMLYGLGKKFWGLVY